MLIYCAFVVLWKKRLEFHMKTYKNFQSFVKKIFDCDFNKITQMQKQSFKVLQCRIRFKA